LGGGLSAGAAVGWLLFDPAAQLIDMIAEAAMLGFVVPTAIMLADILFMTFAARAANPRFAPSSPRVRMRTSGSKRH
jgi:hypothetical protein